MQTLKYKNLIVSPMVEQLDIIIKGLGIYNFNHKNQIIIDGNVYRNIGVGLLNSCINLNRLISKYKPKNVLLVGCAGALSNNLNINDVVYSNCFFSKSTMDMQFEYSGKSKMPIYNIRTKGYKKIKLNSAINVSTDYFINSKKQRLQIMQKLHKIYNVKKDSKIFVDMQSFSCAQICNLSKVNFSVIRQISDIAGQKSNFNINKWFKQQHNKLISVVKQFLIREK